MKIKAKRKLILKVFAVIFSFVIWFYVLSSTSVILTKDIQVEYQTPVGYSLASDVPKFIKYKLKGPRAIINDLIQDKERLKVDLKTNFSSQNRRYTISYLNYSKRFPFGVKTVDVEPKSIQVYLIKNSIRTLPIKLSTFSSVDEDLLLNAVTLLKKTVKVIGAKNVIGKIKNIETSPIDFSQIKASQQLTVRLESPDNRVRLEPSVIDIKVKVKKRVHKFNLTGIPIKFNSKKAIISSSLKRIDLNLESLDEFTEAELLKEIRVIANIPDISNEIHKISLNIDLPDGIRLIKSSANKIEVKTGN